MKFRIFAQH